MTAKRLMVLAVMMLLLVPTSVLAGAAPGVTESFPNDKDGNTKNVFGAGVGPMNVKLHVIGCNPVMTTVALPSPMTGEAVSIAGSSALCRAAVAEGWICSSVLPACAGSPGNDACCANLGGANTVSCSKDCGKASGDDVFSIIRQLPLTDFEVEPTAGTAFAGVDIKTDGHTVIQDLGPQYCIGVDRAAVNGNITFTIHGRNATPININTSSFPTDTALHNEITAQFMARGVTALSLPNGAGGKCRFAEDFRGPTVFLPNVQQQVTGIGASGPVGITIAQETRDVARIPTLSEWGLILLVALLSLSALWMLRRRRQIGSAV